MIAYDKLSRRDRDLLEKTQVILGMSKMNEINNRQLPPRLPRAKSTENIHSPPTKMDLSQHTQYQSLEKRMNSSHRSTSKIKVKTMINEIDSIKQLHDERKYNQSVRSKQTKKDYDPSILEYIRNKEKEVFL